MKTKTMRILLLSQILVLVTLGCSRNSPIPTSFAPPTFEVLSRHPKYDCLFDTQKIVVGEYKPDLQIIEVFGMYVIAPDSAPRNYVIHTANVLAQYIDNDEDGIPDDPAVLKYLVNENFVVPVWTEGDRKAFRRTRCSRKFNFAASMYYDHDQWAIAGNLAGIEKTGKWDTNLEEVWHIVTKGWRETYPKAFGDQKPSLLTDAMDIARGGYFKELPAQYPDKAWYRYYDQTCDYYCQAHEYIYWALMANIGALDPKLTNKCERSSHEWHICTASELRHKDALVSRLLNDMAFKLPTRIPDGGYLRD